MKRRDSHSGRDSAFSPPRCWDGNRFTSKGKKNKIHFQAQTRSCTIYVRGDKNQVVV